MVPKKKLGKYSKTTAQKKQLVRYDLFEHSFHFKGHRFFLWLILYLQKLRLDSSHIKFHWTFFFWVVVDCQQRPIVPSNGILTVYNVLLVLALSVLCIIYKRRFQIFPTEIDVFFSLLIWNIVNWRTAINFICAFALITYQRDLFLYAPLFS